MVWLAASLVLAFVLGILFVELTPLGVALPHDYNGASLLMMRLQTYAFALSGVTGVGTLLTAVAAARFANHAARESRRSADIAREAMISSGRAWIHVDLTLDDKLVWDESGNVQVKVRIKVSNIGNSPAINVHTAVRVVPDCDDTRAWLDRISRKARVEDRSRSRMVLPHDSFERQQVARALATDFKGVPGFPRLRPAIVGCVTYQLAQDMSLHQTAFCYTLSRIDSAGKPGSRIYAGKTLDADKAHLDWGIGGFAD